MNKINIWPIIAAHLDTLRDRRFGSRRSVPDLIMFFVLPAVAGILLLIFGFSFRADAVNGFLTAFAILTGLLLNLLVLIFTLAAGSAPPNMDLRARKVLLVEVFANVCFCLLNAIAVVCVSVVALSYMRSMQGATTGRVSAFLLCFLTMNFVLTLLMVIKRMYVLLQKEIKRTRSDHAA
jgi:hypothetical protein